MMNQIDGPTDSESGFKFRFIYWPLSAAAAAAANSPTRSGRRHESWASTFRGLKQHT